MRNADLARMIAASRRIKRIQIAMLWAYFDETVVNVAEKDGKLRPRDMFVGGCVADQGQWEKFTPEWLTVLAGEGVKTFHAKDFYAFEGEFKWSTRESDRDLVRHGKFRDRLADTILEYADELTVFTSMAPIRDKGTRKAYQDAALRAIYDLTKNKTGLHDSVYVILARHPELSPWSILRKFEQIDWECRLAGCGIFLPDDAPPLQATDFVLHSPNKRWGGLETASFKRLSEGCAKRNKRFLQQIGSTLNIEKLLASLSS
jgi:hypothetical protein